MELMSGVTVGAVYAMLAAFVTTHPDANLQIIFLPFIDINATLAFGVLLGIDTLGLVLRWSSFGHAAHLGGALFGFLYTQYGHVRLTKQMPA